MLSIVTWLNDRNQLDRWGDGDIMWAILGRLFGTEKALGSMVSAARDGLDALVYTDEEKAGDAAKNRTEARQMVVEWMKSTQGQNLARRMLALSITGVWLLQYVLSQALSVAAIFVQNPEKIVDAADVMISGAEQMNSPVMLILAFYFAAPHMGKFAEAFVNGKK